MEGKGINKRSFQERGWLKLDNCAKLFPAITSSELTSVFRVTAYLKEPVKYSAIRDAVEITSERFPYFSVSLGSGLFWHFLEFNNRPPRILVEENIPCTAFAIKRNNEPLFRVLVKSNRISVEFIHILTDGYGAFEYFKSLLYTYLTISGNHIRTSEGIILPETPFSEEEIEDGYNKFFQKLPPPDKLAKAWHIPFRLNKKPRLKVIRAEMDVNELLEVARSHKVTITEYIVSVYLFSLQKIYLSEKEKGRKQKGNVLRTEVPVNLRNKLPSRTMRNFSLFILPEVDMRLGTYTFEEMVRMIHLFIQAESDIKQIARFLSSNVSHEKQLILRIMPLFIKRMAISAVYKGLGSKRFTGIITNLGSVKVPVEMQELIESFEIIPPPPNLKVKVSCAMVSFKDKLRLCFCNITQSNELERHILKHLSDSGIHIKILNNN
ncbi:MAG: hypothetical protein MUC93_07620 [Bacteroidales bacterium]|jgi:NRPS condensation-like uncharacterized protein|nr:hypothetical protein [Bacteroidales bacterium]